ncbi:MAG: hypothetical protein AAGM22_16115 [Acidobacteriota bacterium]
MSASPIPHAECPDSDPDTDSFELATAGDTLAQAREAAVHFIDDAAPARRGLVGLPSGVALGRMDSLTPALALGWLPTLSIETRRHFLEQLAEFDERPVALVTEGPPHLEAQAALTLAHWRVDRRPDELQRAAVRLLAAGLEAENRGELTAAEAAWLLHPVLLAARLARFRLDRPVFVRVGRMPRRIRPLDVVKRYLDLLCEFLIDPGVQPAAGAPPTEWTLCLATELWRNTTPWSAIIRAPLEVTLWERWRHLKQIEDLDASVLSSILIAAENLHIDVDLASLRWRLAAQQEADGGFAAGPLVTVTPGPRYVGSRTVTTILAARALGGQPRTGGGRLR